MLTCTVSCAVIFVQLLLPPFPPPSLRCCHCAATMLPPCCCRCCCCAAFVPVAAARPHPGLAPTDAGADELKGEQRCRHTTKLLHHVDILLWCCSQACAVVALTVDAPLQLFTGSSIRPDRSSRTCQHVCNVSVKKHDAHSCSSSSWQSPFHIADPASRLWFVVERAVCAQIERSCTSGAR